MPLTERERAYIAGLFDGEGSINISAKKSGRHKNLEPYPSVSVTNTYRPIIEYLCQTFGGAITSQNGKKTPESSWRTTYRWHLWRLSRILDFLLQLEPQLVIKKEQAKLMIEYCESRLAAMERYYRTPYSERDLEIILAIQKLNTRYNSRAHVQAIELYKERLRTKPWC